MTGVSHADGLAAELANTGRKGEIVFAQSDEMTVTFSEDLPTEVKGVIERGGTRAFMRKENAELRTCTDAWDESYSGGYDHATSYAWACNSQTCFLWKPSVSLGTDPNVT